MNMKNKPQLDEETEDFKALKAEWLKEARDMTLDNLPEFLRKLTEDYEHDYGTICHAMSVGAIATLWAMNASPQGGVIGMKTLREWTYSGDKLGFKVVDFDHLLYPQYAAEFEKTVPAFAISKAREQATKLLKENAGNQHVSPAVHDHWQFLAAGGVPFGLTVEREDG